MPDHLVRQSHSWCFRLVIPVDLRGVVGKSELRYTLYTGSRRIASPQRELNHLMICYFSFTKLMRV
jgi:hypothetical protein